MHGKFELIFDFFWRSQFARNGACQGMHPDRVALAALGIAHGFSLHVWRLGMEPRLCMFHRGAGKSKDSDVPFAASGA